jgi:hypothetical protein
VKLTVPSSEINSATARDVDLEMGVNVTEVEGPVSRRLREFGPVIPLVFGGFAEASEGVHDLVDLLSKFRLKKEGNKSGREGSKRRLGVIVGQIRRRLSLATVKANTTCMLSRLGLTGDRASEAGKKRKWQRREEALMSQERQAMQFGRQEL